MARSALVFLLILSVTQAGWLNLPSLAMRASEKAAGFDAQAPKQDSEEVYDDSIEGELNMDFVKLPSPWELGEPVRVQPSKPKVVEKTVKKVEPLKSMLDDPHEERNVEIIEGDQDSSEEVEEIGTKAEKIVKMMPVGKGVEPDDDDESQEIIEEGKEGWEKGEDSPNLKYKCLKRSGKKFESKSAPREWELESFAPNDLPAAFDWRNVNGVNYCSPTRNQHIPVYCGSCWVFGTTGALNDRFNIARKNRWPMTMVSPQEIIDCNGKGNCQGGEVGNVLEYAKTQGLVEEGCNVYRATNGECTPFHRCGTCWPDSCFHVTNYTRYFIKDYGQISGREKMMAEIMKGGPIPCSIAATPKFDYTYTGGVYAEKTTTVVEPNHIVSVTGWGVDASGIEYWIVRNSWGEGWGERGWYRTVTSKYMNGTGNDYNMGIEKDCYFADVDASNID